MVARHAARWIRRCWRRRPARVVLVQDHERCLWQDDSLQCLKTEGLHVLRTFPKSSPDLNAIEGVWGLLRDYLESNSPGGLETRAKFLLRLHGAVRHLNATCANDLLKLCRNQQDRARDVLANKGSRTRW